MDQQIEAYEKARKEYDRATLAANDMSRIVRSGAKLLERWDDLMIGGVPNANYPLELVFTNTINALEWPTPGKMNEILMAWHRAREAMAMAHSNLSESQRSAATPLPKVNHLQS
jgi:hypothetical protein